MLDDNTCLVNHLLNAWFCTNANHICFSKCLLYLLLLKESQDGATLESAHFELQDDKYLVNVHFYTAKPSLSHGDLVFDPRSDLSQGRGDDAEHPMDITMSRVRLASDTCDIYFTYTKVNHLLYTCSLDPFEVGILLDTSPVCMHRYCRSFTDVEEECKRQGTTTPSAREAWKQRRKMTETAPGPGHPAQARTSGRWRQPIQQQPPSHQLLQAPDIRRPQPGNPASFT